MLDNLLKGLLSTALLASTVPHFSSPAAHLAQLEGETPVASHVIWVVKPGESLTSIAEQYYGSSEYWTTIWNDNNGIQDPNVIEANSVLTLRSNKPSQPDVLKDELLKRLSAEPTPPPEPTTAVSSQSAVASAHPLASSYPQSNFDAVYQAAGAKYGVPWQILYGLHLTETGLRNGPISSHSGSGAQGPMQFMPGTWNAYGVDGDGDGVADINNAVDAIYAAANFIAKHGSVANALKYYGGNTAGVLAAAESRGYTP